MCKKSNKKSGFTMMELLLVVVIIAAMAAFSVPNFTRSITRARARDAINNLAAIHAAQLIYRSLNGAFNRCNNVAAINALNGANSLNVIQNGATYACNNANPPTTCTAVSADFTVTANLNSPISLGTNPSCAPTTAGACP